MQDAKSIDQADGCDMIVSMVVDIERDMSNNLWWRSKEVATSGQKVLHTYLSTCKEFNLPSQYGQNVILFHSPRIINHGPHHLRHLKERADTLPEKLPMPPIKALHLIYLMHLCT